MPKSKAKAGLSFVDAHGGALAALAAGVARNAGGKLAEALAATTSKAVEVPPEIAAVLAEIGAAAPSVVLASALAAGVERIDLGTWGLTLHEGEGPQPVGRPGAPDDELERLSSARIARDRIERRLSANGAAAAPPAATKR